MDDNNQELYPMAPTHGQAKNDVESPSRQSEVLRQSKCIKYVAYFSAFDVFQTIIMLVFALTEMCIKGPKFRLRSVANEDLSHTSNTTSSFNIRFYAQVTAKNLNFGHYKFKSSTITFAYGATMVGEAFILRLECKQDPPERSMYGWQGVQTMYRATQTLSVIWIQGFWGWPAMENWGGKCIWWRWFRRKKSAQMNCTIIIDLPAKAIRDLQCN